MTSVVQKDILDRIGRTQQIDMQERFNQYSTASGTGTATGGTVTGRITAAEANMTLFDPYMRSLMLHQAQYACPPMEVLYPRYTKENHPRRKQLLLLTKGI